MPGAETKEVAVAAVDTLLWQAFASVIVPGERAVCTSLYCTVPCSTNFEVISAWFNMLYPSALVPT